MKPQKELIISADDYGLSRGMTDHILDAVVHGAVNSVSIIPNGEAFEYAIEKYKKLNPLPYLSIHLNLLEGKPLNAPQAANLLVDANGEFCRSFSYFFFSRFFLGRKKFGQLRAQVRLEIEAQIRRVTDCFDKDFKIRLDSHRHVHVIPFIFDIITEIHKQLPISYVRLPKEKFFFQRSIKALSNYIGPNVIKHALLYLLSNRAERCLLAAHMPHCDYFIGALFAGKMSEQVLRKALPVVMQSCPAVVECVFHPGEAVPGEEGTWRNHPELKAYYYSPWRRRERAELLSASLISFLDGHMNQH